MAAEMVLIAEAEKQHPNEWLLFEVTELDERGYPLRGRLLAHSPDRSVVYQVLMQVRPPIAYVVWTGEIQGVFVL